MSQESFKVEGMPYFGVRHHAVFYSGKQPNNTNKLRTTCRATAKRCRATALQSKHLIQKRTS